MRSTDAQLKHFSSLVTCRSTRLLPVSGAFSDIASTKSASLHKHSNLARHLSNRRRLTRALPHVARPNLSDRCRPKPTFAFPN